MSLANNLSLIYKCKSNNVIIIRMWSIIRNSVLNIGLLVFPPKLRFQFES